MTVSHCKIFNKYVCKKHRKRINSGLKLWDGWVNICDAFLGMRQSDSMLPKRFAKATTVLH